MKLRDKPCERCGWKFQTFHVCVDLSKPCEGEVTSNQKAATSEHWRKKRALHAERNAEIVDKYSEGATMQELADLYDLTKDTISRVLHRAEDEGRVTIRPRGQREPAVRGTFV